MAELIFDEFFANQRTRLEALYLASGAARWSVSLEDFARAVWQGVLRAGSVERHEIPELLGTLRVEDLALALGCA